MKRILTQLSLATLFAMVFVLGFTPTVQASTFQVTNTYEFGPGALRQAILDANRFPDEDRIEFSIPGAGVRTIVLSETLPAIIYPVIIDGYTQPGAAPNTLEVGNNAVLLIELQAFHGCECKYRALMWERVR